MPKVIHFTHPNVLNEQIWSITQAEDDRLYFGTSDGVIFFDGSNWSTFEPSQQDVIRSVLADDKGKIYKGNYNAFGYWERDDFDQLEYVSLSEKIDIEIKEEIWHILDLGDVTYFQSFSAIYKHENGSVKKLEPIGNIMFLQSVRDQVFVQSIGGGIYKLNSSDQFDLLESSQFFSDKKVVSILPFQEDGLLIGTEHEGLFVWDQNNISTWNTPLQNEFGATQINKGIRLSNGDFAFGTILNGVYILDENGKRKIHLNRQRGLPDNTVLSLLEDKEGNLWVGLDKGVALVNLTHPLLFYKDVKGDLGIVYTAAEFENHLYIGTNRGVFFKKKNTKQDLGQNEFQFISGTQGHVWQLEVFGNELLCGHNEGTFSISKNKVIKLYSDNGGWTTQYFLEDRNLLLQGTYTGLVVLNKDNDGKWNFSHRVDDFLEPVKEVVIAPDGGIWLAHPIEGLYRVFLDEDKREITKKHKFSQEDGLPSDKNISIIYSEDKVWALSAKKWYWYNDSSERFEHSIEFRNISTDKINGKIALGDSSTWFEILPHQINCMVGNNTYSFQLSLVGDYERIIAMPDGDYLICLDDGYALLKLDNLKNDYNKVFPNIRLSQIEVLEKDSTRIMNPLDKAIKLKNLRRRLRFHFYQPHFSSSPSFRYRLLGVEDDWSPWTAESFKEYSNLQQGDYTFEVESKYGDQSDSVSFEILPHWSKSVWAYCIYLLGAVGFLWLFQFSQKRKFEIDKRIMKEEQNRLLIEQQMQADNEKLQIDILNKSEQLANSTMGLVQKNEILLKLKGKLLELQKKSGVQIPSKDNQELLRIIDLHLTSDQDWKLFEKNFNQVHELFLKKIKIEYPLLTPGDLQLAAYLKMNLSSKEIAPLLHISIRGIENKRYRLRKKIGLSKERNLTEFLMKY